MSVRILVTAAGGALAPLNIRLLKESRRHEVWVAGVDTRPDAAGRYFADAFAVVPPGDAPGYVDAIAELVERHSIDLVLPWSDEEALALAASRTAIEGTGARLACAPLETLEIMTNKAASYERLEAAGVAIPDWSLAADAGALRETVDRFVRDGREFAVKPLVARGNRGAIVVRNDVEGAQPYFASREWHMDARTFKADYLTSVEQALPAMVMERLFPPAYDIDVLAQDGELLRVMPRRRLNPAGVPFTGGVLAPDSEPLIALARSVTRALSVSWLYDYDVMTDAQGRPMVIEVNPRPSGSIAAAILAGMPFYDDLISLAKGEPLPGIAMPDPVAVIPFTDCRIVAVDALP